jgi:hypothetical protein
MAHLQLRYESALPAFSDVGIWDIADRAPVARLDEIEKWLGESIKQGTSAIHRPGLAPVTVDRWADVLFDRWNRMVLTIIDVDRTSLVGWYAWVNDYVDLRNYPLGLAVQTAVLRYLASGNPQPLVYLIRWGWVPSAKVRKHIAWMLTQDSRVFYIGIRPKRGRRRKGKNSNLEEENPVLYFMRECADLLAAGKYVPHRFWNYLAAAFDKDLRPAVQQKYQLQGPFSVEAKIDYKKRSPEHKGDRKDLDLIPRDRRLAQCLQDRIVQDRIDKRKLVENARADVVDDWNATVSNELRIKTDTLKKIQTAYNIHKPPRVRKPPRPARAGSKSARLESQISDWSIDKSGIRERTKTGN